MPAAEEAAAAAAAAKLAEGFDDDTKPSEQIKREKRAETQRKYLAKKRQRFQSLEQENEALRAANARLLQENEALRRLAVDPARSVHLEVAAKAAQDEVARQRLEITQLKTQLGRKPEDVPVAHAADTLLMAAPAPADLAGDAGDLSAKYLQGQLATHTTAIQSLMERVAALENAVVGHVSPGAAAAGLTIAAAAVTAPKAMPAPVAVVTETAAATASTEPARKKRAAALPKRAAAGKVTSPGKGKKNGAEPMDLSAVSATNRV